MKKYFISFFIPWLLFYCTGCSVEELTFEKAAEVRGKYDISLYTDKIYYLLPAEPDTIKTNGKYSKNIYCVDWKFNLSDVDLVYRYFTPFTENGISYRRTDTVKIAANEIEKITITKFDSDAALTLAVTFGAVCLIGLVIYLLSDRQIRRNLLLDH